MTKIEELEDRISALEAEKPVDQLTPSYITVNPDGTISADFTGTIHATGGTFSGELDAATGTFSGTLAVGTVIETPQIAFQEGSAVDPTKQIKWTSDGTITGTVEEALQGYGSGGVHTLIAIAGGQTKVILNSNGASDFVLPRQVGGGQAQVAINGTIAGHTGIAHGLQATPLAVVANAIGAGGLGVPITCSTTNYTGTTFDLYIRTTTSINATITCAYIAITI